MNNSAIHSSTVSSTTQTSFPWYHLSLPFSERRLLLFWGDVLMLIGTIYIAIMARTILQPSESIFALTNRPQLFWLGLLLVGWLLFIYLNDGYVLKNTEYAPKVARIIFIATMETIGVYLILFFFFGHPVAPTGPAGNVSFFSDWVATPPRIITILFFAIGMALVVLWRWSYTQFFVHASFHRRGLVVGAGVSGRTLVKMVASILPRYEIVGFIDDDPAKQDATFEGIPVLGNRETLMSWVEKYNVQEIVLAITSDIHNDLFNILLDCYERGISIKPMPFFYEEIQGRTPIEHLGQKWFMAPFWENTGSSLLYRLFKRTADIVLASIGIVMLVPMLPFIALAIRIDSPGPIFYKQQRVGQGGKLFWIYKFRSMCDNAEKAGNAIWAEKNDSRITKVGKFLRRTRLDEVPQVYNVLLGNMSIVGPRPERPEFIANLQKEIPLYRTRLSVKPGLTGWAQVEYRYGNTVDDALRKSQYDLYYIRHRSIMFELQIMFKTAAVMLMFKGT